MKNYLLNIYRVLVALGADPVKFTRALKGIPFYCIGLWELKRQKKNSSTKFNSCYIYPCLEDRFLDSGLAKGHYFHQDLLIAE